MAQETVKYDIRSLDVDKKIVSSIDNGIVILDDELNIYYYNRWLEIHTGLKESEVLNRKLDDIFDTIKSKTLKRKIKSSLRLQTPTFYTASISKYLIPIEIDQIKISHYSHMQQDVSIVPFDQENSLVALIITDQTNMANTNALLQSNILKIKELNSELIKERQTIDEKVLLIKFDTNFKITDVSKAYLYLLKYEKEDLINNNFFEYHKFSIKKRLKTKIMTHTQEQKVLKYENSILSSDGKSLILLNTLVPEYDAFSYHIGFILFIENVTDSKKVIAQQDKLLVTSRSAAMGEMISMIAHQWRQPLSVVNTIIATVRVKQELDILNDSILEKAFTKIEETVGYLSATIDDFRNYFKPNKVITKISIANIVDKSTTFLLGDFKQFDIKFTVLNESNIEIETYQNELIQCVINVLKNSVDAFKEGDSQQRNITLLVKEEHSVISLLFKDNAGGIEKSILKKVFEPYFSTKAKNGTGLGLYMTKTIVEEHLNGKITVTSSDGKTAVLIELPPRLNYKKEKNENSLPTLSKC